MDKNENTLKMGAVTLSVADLGRSAEFYQSQLGLNLHNQTNTTATLGTDIPLLHLQEITGARHYRRATGLFHFAIVVPSRTELARVMQHLAQSGTRIDGASNHHVSEAIYLRDPDGHGIEIYRDTPKSTWTDANGNFYMTTGRMDIDDVLSTHDGKPFETLAAGAVMGHVHLQVDDVASAETFYTSLLSFDTMSYHPSAAFISYNGYHHHLGLNSWNSRGAKPAPADAARLLEYEIVTAEENIGRIYTKLASASYPFTTTESGIRLLDPAQNGIHIVGS